jgi:ERCC4-type nuclease
MKIIIDERETALYNYVVPLLEEVANPALHLEKRVLELGDVLFTSDADETLSVIERKSFSDLLASIKDGRYTEQSYRLLGTYPVAHNIIYMLEGVFSSSKDRQKIISTIASLNMFKGFSVIRTTSLQETAQHVVYMADKVERDLKKGKQMYSCISVSGTSVSATTGGEAVVAPYAVAPYCSVIKSAKKANITRENIGEIILCQIPGISSTTAVALMQPFTTFAEFLDKVRAEPDYLKSVVIENNEKKRKLGSNIIEGIQTLLY